MGSVTNGNGRERLERLLAGIENEANRATARRYVDERLANGVHPGTVANGLTAVRDFCAALGRKRLENATRKDVAGFVADMRVQRTWRSKRTDGSLAEAQRTVSLSPGTAAERRKALRTSSRGSRAMRRPRRG